jgi:hypothetical protein
VWFSASPRVQRLAAAHVAALLGAALTVVAAHQRPDAGAEPLALAAATAPVVASVAAVDQTPPARSAPVRATRPATPPRRKAKPRPSDPGWDYWSSRIRGCESHGRPDAPADYTARNPRSSASGAYQIVDATWAGRYGVSHASDATPEQQDAVAAELYRRHGSADWAASAACWRAR